jgi:4-hydroxybenzoate polyprenyltransferase
MKLLSAFFKLIRWPNLVFIALTQALFYYAIVIPSFAVNNYNGLKLNLPLLICLILSSVLIAAAGYIINDYFDLNIDQVNKPDDIIIQKIIRRRWAIIWHLALSALGVLLAVYVGWKIKNILLPLANFLCVLLLWFYSTTFKKKLLIGNVIIALLTAWVILVIYCCEVNVFLLKDSLYNHAITRVFKFTIIYAGFAFIISLIREVVKDMEDIGGDERYSCRTMPVVWGIPASRVFVVVWLIVLTVSVIILQVYAVLLGWWAGIVYSLLLIVFPLLTLFRDIYRAGNSVDYHKLSTRIKLIMFTGILSMIFFIFYS